MIEQRGLTQPAGVSVDREVRRLPGRRLLARLGTGVLGVALLTLAPLARASPPDPAWMAGWDDDADHDDAIMTITDASGSPARDAAAIVPAGVPDTVVAFAGPTRFSQPFRIGLLDRSPPLGQRRH